MTAPKIGPVLAATIISSNYQQSIDAWCNYLEQHIHSQEKISEQAAIYWGKPALANRQLTWLANELGEPWLRIIDSPDSQQRIPFTTYGWLSLEISVQNVDELFSKLKDSPFEIIGEPADLDVSDDIRAMQVIGLDGEVLYLTQVKAEVPPFEIPFARCPIDRLFIPVCLVNDRESAAANYLAYANTKNYSFDTKITVINRALGFDITHRHPVATVQLAGQHMVEIDQIADLAAPITDGDLLQAGISSISFAVTEFPQGVQSYRLANGTNSGDLSALVTGSSGELLELIKQA